MQDEILSIVPPAGLLVSNADLARDYLSSASFRTPDWIPEVSAWIEHAPFAFWLVEQLRPSCVVELGTHWGYSYLAFCQAVEENEIFARCYAVDTWQGDVHAGFYSGEVFGALNAYNSAKYGRFSRLIRSTFDEALGHFADGSIDLLHIDGMHTYEAAKHDFESWRPKLSARAVVLFHDTNVRERGFGIWQLWEELALDFPHFEFHHCHGLGILGVGSDLPPIFQQFLALPDDSASAQVVRQCYARLGSGVAAAKTAREWVDSQSKLQILETTAASLQNEKNELQADHARLTAHRLQLTKEHATTLREMDDLKISHLEKTVEQKRKAAVEMQKLQRQLEVLQEKLKKTAFKSANLEEIVAQQKQIIRSAQNWQGRSWWTRALHRWKTPKQKTKKAASPAPQSLETTSLPEVSESPLPADQQRYAEIPKSSLPVRLFKNPLPPSTVVVDRSEAHIKLIFSENYYLQQNPSWDGTMPLLRHYETIGWRAGLDPNPWFDVSWYLEQNPDVRAEGVEPLRHYLSVGWLQGRDPHPYFSVAYYLKHYPDAARTAHEPLSHYLKRGWKDGRHPHPAGDGDWLIEFERNRESKHSLFKEEALDHEVSLRLGMINPQKKTILLVTHDTSRTGAPIIVLNLIARFRATYNVVAFALGAGSLEQEFDEASDVFIAPEHRSDDTDGTAGRCLQTLLKCCKIEFALVNSLESTPLLPTLSRNCIPVVHMIHEFAVYIRPRGAIWRAAFYSHASVFSARTVYENALQECPSLAYRQRLICPQGLSMVPVSAESEANLLKERKRIQRHLRPDGWEDAIVVLGMGTVQFRKGVDLFFSCAERVVRNNPQRKIRFVWIGHGFEPDSDLKFSVYLADQLHRMALGDSACLTDEISQVDLAYELADFFFISSRLDPLPLVSQEAMAHGLPIVCFENAVGTAEVLQLNPLTAQGVVPYLNIEAAAQAIQTLIDDPQLRDQVGENCRLLASEYFDMDKYVPFLEATALAAVERQAQEVLDSQSIADSGVLDLSYLLSPNLLVIRTNPAWWFTRSWASGISLRKPFPGFHPGIYAEKNGLTDRDPTAHYLAAGKPGGPWSYEVIEADISPATTQPGPQPRVALHLHLYFIEMAADLLERLAKVQTPIDLFISVASTEAALEAENLTKTYPGGTVTIRIVPNRGRDIGPFLTEFGQILVDNYDFFGHIHTKRSLHVKSPAFIEAWATFLYENMLGGLYPMVDTIVSRLQVDPTIGLVFPDDPNVIGWGGNSISAMDLAKRMGIREERLYEAINFPVGTMFWARPAAIKPLFDLKLQWEDYPAEPLPDDDTMLHGIERLLPIIAEKAGFRSAVTHVAGVTR